MSRIRHLIREIHRRSLWQVLGVFLAMSWGVLNAVDVLTGFAGLPDWTPTMALVLLMIGLPVVMATAVVQEGLPGQSEGVAAKGGGDRVSGEGAGRSSVPADHRGADDAAESNRGKNVRPDFAGLLTWRNAIVGGGLAALLLTVAAGGYLAMWAFGVGPVGSLVAQGVLDERDPIVVARFESSPDPALGEVVTEALSVDLGQSQTVTLLGRDAVRTSLGLMGRDPNDPVTPEVAREIAIRENLKAYVTGDVSRVGTRYLLVGRIVSSDTDTDLVSFREEAADDDDLLPAIDRLSTKLREKMGESLKSIRLGTPLEEATTSSLEALRKLTEAERAEERGDYETANRLLQEAVALDSAFAQAHRKISVLLFNVGAPRDRVEEAARNAYAHRDRLTERERYLVEANYHNTVTRDTDAVIRAYQGVLATNPDEGAALNNLANIYRGRGQDEEARELLEKAVSGPGASSVSATNLVFVSLNLGDLPGAERAAETYRERYPGHIYQGTVAFQLASFRGEHEAIHRWADTIASDPNVSFLHDLIPSFLIAADVEDGRIGEALDHGGEIDAAGVTAGLIVRRRNAATGVGDVRLWILDDPGAAASAARDFVRRVGFENIPASERGWENVISTLALAGDTESAEALLRTKTSEDDADPVSHAIAEGMVHFARGEYEQALARIEDAGTALRCDRCVEIERALALEALDRSEEAIEIWERVRATPLEVTSAGWERIIAIKKLGPLYEEVGDSAAARGAYEALVDAWSEADPVLRPQVDAARARVSALGG